MLTTHLRVDWSDLDLFGHVNNVAFFKYIQASRVHFCDSLGLSSLNKTELSFIVTSTQCNFLKPLNFPDQVEAVSSVEWIKNSSYQLNHELKNGKGEVVAQGHDILVVYNYHLAQKAQIDGSLKKQLLDHLQNPDL